VECGRGKHICAADWGQSPTPSVDKAWAAYAPFGVPFGVPCLIRKWNTNAWPRKERNVSRANNSIGHRALGSFRCRMSLLALGLQPSYVR
jgi:hypothetical protein